MPVNDALFKATDVIVDTVVPDVIVVVPIVGAVYPEGAAVQARPVAAPLLALSKYPSVVATVKAAYASLAVPTSKSPLALNVVLSTALVIAAAADAADVAAAVAEAAAEVAEVAAAVADAAADVALVAAAITLVAAAV